MTITRRQPSLTVEVREASATATRRRPVARQLPAWLEAIFASSLRQRIVATLIALAVIAMTGWLGYRGVVRSLEASREAYLRALVDAKSAAVQVWLDDKHQDAHRWAQVPEVRRSAQELMVIALLSPDGNRTGAHGDLVRSLSSAPAQHRLQELVRATLQADARHGAIKLIARDGRIISSHDSADIGTVIGIDARAELVPLFNGAEHLLAPHRPFGNAPGAPAVVAVGAVLWFAAPVRGDDGSVVAALAMASTADDRLAQLLAPGRTGDAATDGAGTSTIEAYAFDRRGVLLVSSHAATAQASNGSAMTPDTGTREDAARSSPMTRLLTTATGRAPDSDSAGDSAALTAGVLVQPYRNHAGRSVIGAWRWLPGEAIGVAIEVDPEEVYSPTQYVRLALQVVFGMLVVAVAVSLASTLSLAGLLRESRRLGPYRLEGVIEEGGMAIVHRAEHALMKRPTAVKILKPHLATDELIARFEREVMLTSRLEHPATVEIYDYGLTRDGTFYFAMEYVDGLTLERLIELDGPQLAARVAHILKQVCESLREAHAKGLVHRDVKPPNIMLCERGGESDVVKVLDWGLIKDVRTVEQRNLTQYARVLGTPDYMPPERVRDPAQADPRVDIYGVGAVAYFLLTGRRLFDAPNAFDLQRMIIEAEAPRAALGADRPMPRSLDELVARCLAKDPVTRPQSVVDLLAVFTDILRVDPWTPAQAAAWWHMHRVRSAVGPSPNSSERA